METRHILELASWIIDAGLRGDPEPELVKGFCERLTAAGVPVWRAIVGADTLHPVIAGRVVNWTDGTDTIQTDYIPEPAEDAHGQWQRSPFHRLYNTSDTLLRRRLSPDAPTGEYPIIDELREKGATDYVAMLHRLGHSARVGELDCVFSSWTTRHPGGFTDAQVEALERLVGHLALAIRALAMAQIAHTLAETYLGRDAAQRVLQGHIRRGVADRIDAVLWFSDLQGFTHITDTADPELIIPLLNDYADAVVSAIHGQGGQVLKFIGDGILAIFRGTTGPGEACRAALDAADDALVRCVALNERRAADGLPTSRFYLGLHMGEVFYGNIGSTDRLDFTVVGPAVNEASRIAAMCRSIDQPVLLSSAFAEAAPDCSERLVSVGRYMLRGVGRPQELFTLDPTVPARP